MRGTTHIYHSFFYLEAGVGGDESGQSESDLSY